MSVYVDDMRAAFGNMTMCHMIADSRAELDEMVDRIGVQRKWIQKVGTIYEHFDICLSKRSRAVRNGAVQVSRKELVRMIHARKPRN